MWGIALLFMDEGSIVEDGSPSEVLRNPKAGENRQFVESVLEPGAIARRRRLNLSSPWRTKSEDHRNRDVSDSNDDREARFARACIAASPAGEPGDRPHQHRMRTLGTRRAATSPAYYNQTSGTLLDWLDGYRSALKGADPHNIIGAHRIMHSVSGEMPPGCQPRACSDRPGAP